MSHEKPITDNAPLNVEDAPAGRLVTRRDAGRFLRLAPGTLANLDSQNRGISPRFRVGRQVLYRAGDVRAYAVSRPIG